MAITPRYALDVAAYNALRYAFIKQVEESGNVSLTAYVDTKGIPTIGLGLNLRTNLNAVMAAFEISSTSAADATYRARLLNVVTTSYPDTTAGEQQLRNDLNAVMADRAVDTNVPGAKRTTFSFNNEDEVKFVFTAIAEATYEKKITTWENNYGVEIVPFSPGALNAFLVLI